MSPLRQIMLGIAIGLVAFGLVPLGCGGGITPLIRCKLDALKVLPKDPRMVTPYDIEDIIERVAACHRMTDGGP